MSLPRINSSCIPNQNVEKVISIGVAQTWPPRASCVARLLRARPHIEKDPRARPPPPMARAGGVGWAGRKGANRWAARAQVIGVFGTDLSPRESRKMKAARWIIAWGCGGCLLGGGGTEGCCGVVFGCTLCRHFKPLPKFQKRKQNCKIK